MNYAGLYKLSLKYHRFTPSNFKDIGTSKSVFVAKTQFLYYPMVKISGKTNLKPQNYRFKNQNNKFACLMKAKSSTK